MDDQVKVTVTLPRGVVEGIRELASANRTTLSVAISDSVNINQLLTSAEKQGSRIILEDRNGSMTRIVRERPSSRD